VIATCQLGEVSGKVPHIKIDQSPDSVFQGKRPYDEASHLQDDQPAEQTKDYAGTEDEKAYLQSLLERKPFEEDKVNKGKPLANNKRFSLGNVINKVKENVHKKYWTKEKFIETLKALILMYSTLTSY